MARIPKSGGAIAHFSDGVLQISNAQFENNRSTDNGGAISKIDGELRIGRSVFENNRADSGGGAVTADNLNIFSTESNFFDNWSISSGGAVQLFGDDARGIFTANTVRGNQSRRGDGGGFSLSGDQGSFISDSIFEQNAAVHCKIPLGHREARSIHVPRWSSKILISMTTFQ